MPERQGRIKDLFTCEIVGYAMGARMTQELVGEALFRAMQNKRPPAGLIHHSDRGSPILRARLSEAARTVWHTSLDVAQGQLL